MPQNQPMPMPPSMALINMGGNTFEFNDDTGEITPYGVGKGSAAYERLVPHANSLASLVPYMSTRWAAPAGYQLPYTAMKGSRYRGVYTVTPQDWYRFLLRDLQLPFTPTEIQPHPTKPYSWLVRKDDTDNWDEYSTEEPGERQDENQFNEALYNMYKDKK